MQKSRNMYKVFYRVQFKGETKHLMDLRYSIYTQVTYFFLANGLQEWFKIDREIFRFDARLSSKGE
jgi:hypothetical protein